jgi:hypothetical protein
MIHYKVEKWVELNKNHKRQYIFTVKNMEEGNLYKNGKNDISTTFTPITGIKYYIMKLFYNCYKKEYLDDLKNL